MQPPQLVVGYEVFLSGDTGCFGDRDGERTSEVVNSMISLTQQYLLK
jgi:hypothetical protein